LQRSLERRYAWQRWLAVGAAVGRNAELQLAAAGENTEQKLFKALLWLMHELPSLNVCVWAAVLCCPATRLFPPGAAAATHLAPLSAHQDLKTVPNGACGYGDLSVEQYPGFMLAGVALDSSAFKGKSLKGCGTCVEVKCKDEVCWQ
jgi:hypothetical protein